ncbi:hypothetical protein [Carboxydothermus pertinax]|uniref:Uncharacterized protein n=1 Tax=Carboxydothermus pertinax TaxID=870242 RepID=A0A1L8CV74_9THEO|nr:hypothetical protein [Carboxydothermus pertinax]GAV22828.1 hypothetical protein cpu_13380 [Carboxydothermus pertinax]
MSVLSKEQLAELELLLGRIKGVNAARVVLDGEGKVDEIHLLAGSTRSPKQIVRDVESALLASFNIAIDHKKISIAQVEESEEDDTREEIRPQVAKVDMVLEQNIVKVNVELAIGEARISGDAEGPATSQNRKRLLALATVYAVENFLNKNGIFVVEDVQELYISGKKAIVVAIAAILGREEENYLGAAYANGDEREAVVKATLAAINRRLRFFVEK